MFKSLPLTFLCILALFASSLLVCWIFSTFFDLLPKSKKIYTLLFLWYLGFVWHGLDHNIILITDKGISNRFHNQREKQLIPFKASMKWQWPEKKLPCGKKPWAEHNSERHVGALTSWGERQIQKIKKKKKSAVDVSCLSPSSGVKLCRRCN